MKAQAQPPAEDPVSSSNMSNERDEEYQEESKATTLELKASSPVAKRLKTTLMEKALQGRVTTVTETVTKTYRTGRLSQVQRVRVYKINDNDC